MWVARDKVSADFSRLHLFEDKPFRYEFDSNTPIEDLDFWDSENGAYELPDSLFPELKWEDEPIEVEIIKK